jgi:hypothetical protein
MRRACVIIAIMYKGGNVMQLIVNILISLCILKECAKIVILIIIIKTKKNYSLINQVNNEMYIYLYI